MEPKINIMAINGSPKAKNNTSILLNEAIKGAKDVGDVEITQFNFAGKKINPCKASCSKYCAKNADCCQKDDFQEFVKIREESDAVLFATPVYHMGLPSPVKAALDRLGQVHYRSCGGRFKRIYKVGGAIAHGGTHYGGQEIVLQQIINHFLVSTYIPVTGDRPESYLGVAGFSPNTETLQNDKVVKQSAYSIGKRVAELTKIVKVGLAGLKDKLPQEYFNF